MSSQDALPLNTPPYVYNTPAGHKLIIEILANCKPRPIELHDHQLEGIGYSMDSIDIVATMATGAGKTGFYCFLMLVICAIAANPDLALEGVTFPSNPALLLVCPTKALQEDMSASMQGFGLETLVINADTCAAAREQNRNLWIEARDSATVILISPEESESSEFSKLINNPIFAARVCVYGIDELHLLYFWGKSFRPCFQQLGLVRARLPRLRGRLIPLVGTSATLRGGKVMSFILDSLGLKPGGYHLIRRSNMRHDIQLIFRQMTSGISSNSFPEIDWVLDECHNTVIFCKTIELGFRVACYLWRRGKSKGLQNLDKRVRLYNSLNWPSYNSETLGFLNNNEDSSITIATDVLSVGWDSQFTKDAIILGEPDDVDEFVQKIGRVGRNRRAVSHPRGFLYYTRSALSDAEAVFARERETPVANDETRNAQPGSSKARKGETLKMDISMARLLLALCKPEEIDKLYDNPDDDALCACTRCRASPPPLRPVRCNCSGAQCAPEQQIAITKPSGHTQRKPKARRGEGLNKDLRSLGAAELDKLRWRIFHDVGPKGNSFFSPAVFLPDDIIKLLIENLYSIHNILDVSRFVQNIYLQNHHQHILDECLRLREVFALHREQKKKELAAKKAGAASPECTLEADASSDSEDSESETATDDFMVVEGNESTTPGEETEELILRTPTSITWRINIRNGSFRVLQ